MRNLDSESLQDESLESGVVLRERAFELLGPGYILDLEGKIIDWNLAFEEFVARPLKLTRNQFVPELICQFLPFHSPDDQPDSVPYVFQDTFELELLPDEPITFRRIFAQILNNGGDRIAWSIYLEIVDPVLADRYSNRVLKRLEQKTIWSKYAAVYDALLLNFSDYVALLDAVANLMAGARTCVDLGTGTGNSAISLLNCDASRTVCAVDSNEFMLNRLREKRNLRRHDRLTTFECDIHRMPFFGNETFDGLTMVNSIYAVDDPLTCLREAHRILKPNGLMVLTSPHSQTDVDRLFGRLKEDLSAKGLFKSLEKAFVETRERHEKMASLIHRFSKSELLSLIESCGYQIESTSSEYVDAVLLIKARKL